METRDEELRVSTNALRWRDWGDKGLLKDLDSIERSPIFSKKRRPNHLHVGLGWRSKDKIRSHVHGHIS